MLLQLVTAVLFGYFIDFTIWILQILSDTTYYPVQIIYLIVGTVLVALGIFIYMPANLFPQPYEGLTRIIANKTGKFPTLKMYFDITHVNVSALLCLFLLGNLG